MSGLTLLLALFCTGGMVFCLVLYLGKVYFQETVLEPAGSVKAKEVSDSFPDNLKLFKLLTQWRMKSKRSLLPYVLKRKIERLWTKSGRKPKELPYFFAKLEILALFAVLVWLLISVFTRNVIFALIAAVPVGLYWVLVYYQFKDSVINRLRQIERELPYVLDLLAMMLYGGGNVFGAFESLTNAPVKTPLIDELRAVTGSLRMGQSLSQALRGFAERVDSDTVKSIVLTVEQGERLGTPLHQVLSSLAHAIRNKRILAAEEQAHRAGVKVFVPASLVMFALMIILLAPAIIRMFASVG
jgi:pilus assembly protein TadC